MNKILQDVWSFFAMIMMIMGIGGLVFHTFEEDGWASRYFGKALDVGLAHPLMGGIIVVATIGLGWASLSGRLVIGNKRSPLHDIPVFLLIFLGMYFTYEWLIA